MNILRSLSRYARFYLLYIGRFLIPVKKGNFLFISMSGNCYGGSPKAFSDYLIEYTDNQVCWAKSEKLHIKDDDVPAVKLYSWRYYYTLLCSQVIVSDQRLWKPMLPVKRRNQIYVQTWHGTALKRIEGDMPNLDSNYVKMAKRDSKLIDVFISGSSFMSQIYRESFWYDGNILEIGTPRSDIFFDETNERAEMKVRQYFDINDEKIVLYAPTFRGNGKMDACMIDTKAIKQLLRKKGKYKILIRLHPNLMGIISEKKFLNFYPCSIDASTYPDMQDLLVASDILITDYSSSMFDYAYSGKPCILYATDIETYDRGFYLSIRDLPFPIAKTNDELLNLLSCDMHFDYSSLLCKIGSYEKGCASKQLYKYLKNKELCL